MAARERRKLECGQNYLERLVNDAIPDKILYKQERWHEGGRKILQGRSSWPWFWRSYPDRQGGKGLAGEEDWPSDPAWGLSVREKMERRPGTRQWSLCLSNKRWDLIWEQWGVTEKFYNRNETIKFVFKRHNYGSIGWVQSRPSQGLEDNFWEQWDSLGKSLRWWGWRGGNKSSSDEEDDDNYSDKNTGYDE